MEEKGQDKIIAFDTLFTTNHIQMLKIFISYLEPPMQKNIAVYIKYLELQYTISFFKQHRFLSSASLKTEPSFHFVKLCSEALPYCSPGEKKQLEGIREMMQTFESYKEMMQMVQMMKELFPEGNGTGAEMDFSSILGMMGGNSDTSQMMEMFQSMSQMFNSGGKENETNGQPSGMDG